MCSEMLSKAYSEVPEKICENCGHPYKDRIGATGDKCPAPVERIRRRNATYMSEDTADAFWEWWDRKGREDDAMEAFVAGWRCAAFQILRFARFRPFNRKVGWGEVVHALEDHFDKNQRGS